MLIIFFYVLTGVTLSVALAFYILVWRPRAKHELAGLLDTVLYRVLMPQDEIPPAGEPKRKEPKDIMIGMEQLFTSLEATRTDWWHDFRFGTPAVTFEMALPHVGEEVTFYVSLPRAFSLFFHNQLHSFFPSAKVDRVEDYNIFHPTGVSTGSIAVLKKSAHLSLRTYRDLGEDPLAVLVGAFSKLKKMGDGAAIQFVVRPARTTHYESGKKYAQRVRGGATHKELFGGTMEELKKMAKGGVSQKKEDEKKAPGDEELAKQLEVKASAKAFDVNIRILASSATPDETLSVIQSLEAAFGQFDNPQGNDIDFIRLGGKDLEEMMYNFSFRVFREREALYLSTAELASLCHFPYAGFTQPKVAYLRAREAPPPTQLPESGIRLGYSAFRGETREVYMTPDDRRRHMYVIGQTGTGKSSLLLQMAWQDIEAGRGVCLIDPHGQDIETLLETIPAGRIDDVIYFNPGDIERPLGLNFLEYDPRFPEQKTFIVNELLEIFNKLYNMSVAGGPMFEQYFRNATMLVMEDPASGNTLLEVGRVLADKEFREYKLSRSSNIVVDMFWRKIADKAGGEASLANMVPYITSKFDTFLSNDIMRPIIAQEKNSFSFREVMDAQQILLINLSKGRLGELNSHLLGLIIVGKILMAALSRTDMPEHERKDFYFYIDEFQNVTTKSIATILSEARKYRLDLIIAHQFLGQLEDEIKKAVFGNVGTMVSFRIGTEDGEFMEGQYSPVFTAKDLTGIENYNAYIKLLIHGEPSRAFNLKLYPPVKGDPEIKRLAIEYSRMKYGRVREEVETSIRARYKG